MSCHTQARLSLLIIWIVENCWTVSFHGSFQNCLLTLFFFFKPNLWIQRQEANFFYEATILVLQYTLSCSLVYWKLCEMVKFTSHNSISEILVPLFSTLLLLNCFLSCLRNVDKQIFRFKTTKIVRDEPIKTGRAFVVKGYYFGSTLKQEWQESHCQDVYRSHFRLALSVLSGLH